MNKRDFEEVKRKFELESRNKNLKKVFNWLVTMLSLIGIAIISSYYINSLSLNNEKIETSELGERFENLIKENEQLKIEINNFKSESKIDTSTQSNDIKISSELEILSEKYNRLERLVLENPEKAITIPLLRKDIENQKNNNAVKIEALNDRIETVLDLNKWILGLIFSLLITIVLSNIFSFLFKKESKEIRKTQITQRT